LLQSLAVPNDIISDLIPPVVAASSTLPWVKSSRCDSGACVEVSLSAAAVGVRNSTSPDAAALWFLPESWTDFLADVQTGRFDRRS
jgi:hypothetical protein